MRMPRRRLLKETVELNITAFLNLMVILVPFLLITAVFSRLTVLELNLPALDSEAATDEQIDLQLQLVIREDSFEIQDANLGTIRAMPRAGAESTDWELFRDTLLQIKTRFPEEDSITLLLERGIPYKTLIDVMDRVRSADVVQVNTVETVQLFPNVSIGDAPAAADSETEPAPAGAEEGGA